MSVRRSPWILPIVVVLAVIALYFAIVGSRSSVDQTQLFGNWVTMAVLFGTFAIIAIVSYVNLRRSGRIDDEAARVRDYRH
jgi:uncharacterized membrane protein